MREESHLDDMRAAIRGDFERLADRRGGQDLMRDVESPPDDEHDPLSSVPHGTGDEDAAPAAAADPERKRSWLARLLDM